MDVNTILMTLIYLSTTAATTTIVEGNIVGRDIHSGRNSYILNIE